MPLGRFKYTRRDWNCMGHISFWSKCFFIYWTKT